MADGLQLAARWRFNIAGENNMYYVWTISEKYPQSYWIKYDWEHNPDYLQFLNNKTINLLDTDVVFGLSEKVSLNSSLKFDYIMSDAIPLISKRLAFLIIDNKIEDLQLIPANVYQGNNVVGEYSIPVFLSVIDCIDKKASIFEKEIDDYTTTVFKPGSLGNKKIVKAKGYEDGNPIVQESFVSLCNQARIKGIDFHKEPFVNPLYSE